MSLVLVSHHLDFVRNCGFFCGIKWLVAGDWWLGSGISSEGINQSRWSDNRKITTRHLPKSRPLLISSIWIAAAGFLVRVPRWLGRWDAEMHPICSVSVSVSEGVWSEELALGGDSSGMSPGIRSRDPLLTVFFMFLVFRIFFLFYWPFISPSIHQTRARSCQIIKSEKI